MPNVTLFQGKNKMKLGELCGLNKKVVLLAVPGAFTPGCSKVHLPQFVENAKEFHKHGVHEIICVSVNDLFVMQAWSKDQNAEGKVRLLADMNAELTKALGMETPMFGGTRSKRYSSIIYNGVFTHFNEEPNGGITISAAEPTLQQVKDASKL